VELLQESSAVWSSGLLEPGVYYGVSSIIARMSLAGQQMRVRDREDRMHGFQTTGALLNGDSVSASPYRYESKRESAHI
jgi:hypothetical protein